jgi:cysteine-rich repeat protein
MATPAQAQNYFVTCGNGYVGQGEFCDDGNTNDGDNCSSNCLFGAPPNYREPYPNGSPYQTISPGGAGGLSLVSSVVLFGFVPSLGHMYAGEYRRAFTSYGIRAGGWALIIAGLGLPVLLDIPFDDSSRCSQGCGEGAVVVGSIAVVGSMVFDVIDAPLGAMRSNQKARRPWQYSVAPTAMPALGGGMSLQLKF